MSDIHPYELSSFDDEVKVQQDLVRVREEIKAALAQRDAVREQARREGLELGRKDAFEAAGKTEKERVARETAGAVDLLVKAAAAIQAKRDEVIVAAERDIVRLAMEIARKVVKVEVESVKRIAAENLRRAVELVARRQELQVLVHPSDLAMIEAYLPELRRQFSDVKNIALESSDAVDRGGAIVRTREGSVDASIAAQLAEIERSLLG